VRRILVTLALLAALFAAPFGFLDDGSSMNRPPSGDYGLSAR
jgi:hypothetical protein